MFLGKNYARATFHRADVQQMVGAMTHSLKIKKMPLGCEWECRQQGYLGMG
jgi:hypothetical protein